MSSTYGCIVSERLGILCAVKAYQGDYIASRVADVEKIELHSPVNEMS